MLKSKKYFRKYYWLICVDLVYKKVSCVWENWPEFPGTTFFKWGRGTLFEQKYCYCILSQLKLNVKKGKVFVLFATVYWFDLSK